MVKRITATDEERRKAGVFIRKPAIPGRRIEPNRKKSKLEKISEKEVDDS